MSTSGYSSNKRSNGYESHELSNRSHPNAASSRLGFRKVKDPYNVSVLHTKANESEEKIIEGDQNNVAVQKAPSQASDQSDRRAGYGITVKREVDVSTNHGKQAFQQNWNAV